MNVRNKQMSALWLHRALCFILGEVMGSDLISPMCLVTHGQYVKEGEWRDMNSTNLQKPTFALYKDGNSTYLQVKDKKKSKGVFDQLRDFNLF